MYECAANSFARLWPRARLYARSRATRPQLIRFGQGHTGACPPTLLLPTLPPPPLCNNGLQRDDPLLAKHRGAGARAARARVYGRIKLTFVCACNTRSRAFVAYSQHRRRRHVGTTRTHRQMLPCVRACKRQRVAKRSQASRQPIGARARPIRFLLSSLAELVNGFLLLAWRSSVALFRRRRRRRRLRRLWQPSCALAELRDRSVQRNTQNVKRARPRFYLRARARVEQPFMAAARAYCSPCADVHIVSDVFACGQQASVCVDRRNTHSQTSALVLQRHQREW